MAAYFPSTIQGFEPFKCLGRGGFGEVWLAKATMTGIFRAVKVLFKTGRTKLEMQGLRDYAVYADEHQHLIKVFHVQETADCYYYVLELADGYATAPTFDPDTYEPRTLAEELRRRGVLPVDEACDIALQVLEGLNHLHASGLVHRDVKPSNTLFVGGVVKLADIGLVVRTAYRAGQAGAPAYAPPGGVRDASGDLYCLGKVLFQIVTGTPPERIPSLPPTLDAEQGRRLAPINAIVDRACDPDPAGRFHSAAEMSAALEKCCPVGARRLGAGGINRRTLLAGAAAVALGAIALAAILWRGGGSEGTGSGGQNARAGARLDVWVKDSKEDQSQTILTPEHLPLRRPNLIKITGRLPSPRYLYLFMVDPEGSVRSVYPGSEADNRPRRQIELPDSAKWWELDDDRGTEVVVMLASGTRIADWPGLADKLRQLGPPPSVGEGTLVLLTGGQVVARQAGTRSVLIDQPVEVETGMFKRLYEAFRSQFDCIEAVAFPHAPSIQPTTGAETSENP